MHRDSDAKRNERCKGLANILIRYRWLFVSLVVLISGVLATFLPSLRMEASLKSAFVTSSPAYMEYVRFLEAFGDEEFFFIAIKTRSGARDARVLSALAAITEELQRLDQVVEVLSLANLRFFQQRGGRFGSYPLVELHDGVPALPAQRELDEVRRGFPLLDLLVSDDLKSVGLVVRADDQWKFDSRAIRELIAMADEIVKKHVPEGSDYRIIGTPVIRQAIQKYSLETAIVFGVLSCLMCLVVTVYIFKSLEVTAVTLFILGLCVLWVTGLMALMRIPINPTTSMSFGVILLTTLEIVIHMVTRSYQFRQGALNWEAAVKQTIRYLGRPLLICSTTTAVGFGACMVSSIPMVEQLGLIMALGIPVSFCLAMIMTPFFLLLSRASNTGPVDRMSNNLFSKLLQKAEHAIARHYRLIIAMGVIISVGMFAGAFFIRIDPQMSRQLGPSSPEIKDIKFVQASLASFDFLELILEAEAGTFKTGGVWKQVMELENRLKELPEVVGVDSFFPSLTYVHRVVESDEGSQRDLFSVPGLIPQLFFMSTLSAEGKRLARRYVTDGFDQLRILVRIRNSPSVPISDTIDQVNSTAKSVMERTVQVSVTGDMAVIAAQGADLVKSQIESMILAFAIIAILMMIQMGSVSFGLVSLIPNIPPVAMVFGLMGWFGITLNTVTVFAATVAIGLAVDNTIQYVAQLKREIKLNPQLGVQECVFRAYRLASTPMASWSTVTLMGFLGLTLTPFQAAVNFGILVSASLLMGMFGDLLFMQSMILGSRRARDLLTRLIKKEMAAHSGSS